MVTTQPTKECCRCRAVRATAEFYRRSVSSDGLSSMCKGCALAERRAYRKNNPEKVRAAGKRWREKNPGSSAARARAWREANPERKRENGRTWAAANAERLAEAKRAWFDANRERLEERLRTDPQVKASRAETYRRHRERHRDQRAEAQRVRRMVMDSTPVPLEALDAIWTGLCGICGATLAREVRWPDPLSPSVDHIVPISRGGLHVIENLQWAHLRCNVRKGAHIGEGGDSHRNAS